MSKLEDPLAQRRQRVEQATVEGHQRRRRTELLDGRRPSTTRPHRSWSSHNLHRLGRWSSKAAAGMIVAGGLAVWVVVGAWFGFAHWWEIVLYSTTASVTVLMVFAIQHTQSREQQVTQRKLDELLRAQPGADDQLIAAEVATDEELDALASLNSDDRKLATSAEPDAGTEGEATVNSSAP